MKYIKAYENDKSLNDKLIKLCTNQYPEKELIKVEKIKSLILQGANINYIGIDINTPLTTAVQYGNVEIVKELLKHPEIDLEIKGTMEPDMLSNRDSTAFVIASRGSLKILEMLFNAGADINSIGHKGSTALIEATAYGMTDNMIFLIKNGANMLIKDKYGDDFTYNLGDDSLKFLKEKCPIEYEKYLIEKEGNKYNL